METIYGENYAGCTNHCRKASRAVILRDGAILLSHERNIDQWMIPGGGLEKGETPESCCVREVSEETGFVVVPKEHFLTLHEYYEDWEYISYYFVCEVVGTTQRNPTKREIQVGAMPEWIALEEALERFSRYGDYAQHNEERRGIYLREYRALSCYQSGSESERMNARK